MKLGIVGGRLQGIESTYLARKAGFETFVIDRRPEVPAFSLADEFKVIDVVKQRDEALRSLSNCNAILPANEDIETLTTLDKISRELKIPLLFDLDSYNISCSKFLSNQIMKGLNIPMPDPWPNCSFPVIIKPSSQSGSTGVMKVHDEEKLREGMRFISEMDEDIIVQEFVDGPNISIEVIGNGKRAVPLILTEVILDNTYDCKMVRCPTSDFDSNIGDNIKEYGRKVAESLSLRGIMDLEAIVHNGIAKVLEFDARIPSQTPATVLHATGINLVKLLFDALVNDELDSATPLHNKAAIYEHIIVDGEAMMSCGEGQFSNVDNLRLQIGLFDSDEMITNYTPRRKKWHAIVICTGNSPQEAWTKRQKCINQIIEKNKITHYLDPVPEVSK